MERVQKYFIERGKNMSKYSKIAQNAENFLINQMYASMGPAQIRNAIDLAVNTERKRLLDEYTKIVDKTAKEYNEKIRLNTRQAIDTISVELLYELANQLGYWDMKEETEEEKYIKASAKFRIQEIYNNTINSITKYSKMKAGNKASREFKKKYNKLEKEFDIEF